jgi:hypothetical protein
MTTLRILIVGQNAHRATALLGRLDGWSCDFYFAATCAEAAPLLKERRFHFVLSQFMLSDGFADQFLPFLEGTRTHSSSPIFSKMTAFGSMFWREAATAGGNHSWFSLTIFSLLSTVSFAATLRAGILHFPTIALPRAHMGEFRGFPK